MVNQTSNKLDGVERLVLENETENPRSKDNSIKEDMDDMQQQGDVKWEKCNTKVR